MTAFRIRLRASAVTKSAFSGQVTQNGGVVPSSFPPMSGTVPVASCRPPAPPGSTNSGPIRTCRPSCCYQDGVDRWLNQPSCGPVRPQAESEARRVGCSKTAFRGSFVFVAFVALQVREVERGQAERCLPTGVFLPIFGAQCAMRSKKGAIRG